MALAWLGPPGPSRRRGNISDPTIRISRDGDINRAGLSFELRERRPIL